MSFKYFFSKILTKFIVSIEVELEESCLIHVQKPLLIIWHRQLQDHRKQYGSAVYVGEPGGI